MELRYAACGSPADRLGAGYCDLHQLETSTLASRLPQWKLLSNQLNARRLFKVVPPSIIVTILAEIEGSPFFSELAEAWNNPLKRSAAASSSPYHKYNYG